MPKIKITKEDALTILELDGTDPSAADIQLSYQQLALKFHPSKHEANRVTVKKFDQLCRSYLVLIEGQDSMEELLTPAQMVDVFIRAFELEALPLSRKAPAQDASTQCDAVPSESTQTTKPAVAAQSTVSAQAAAPTQAAPPAQVAVPAKAASKKAFTNAAMSTKPTASRKAVASASAGVSATAACTSAAASTRTTALGKKPVVVEKPKEEKGAVAATPATKQPDKDAKKAARKANKRRKQKQKREERKASNKAANKEDSSSSSSEEESETDKEEELDPNSAFVATALSRISSGAAAKPRVAFGGVIPKTVSPEDLVTRSRTLAREGYEMCNLCRYKEAIDLFTRAIKLCATEHSYFGNRSYCYTILEKYDKALKDADMAIQLAPHLAKGYYRRGKALLGLQKYSDAVEAFKNVLKIDPACPEALKELRNVRIYEIVSMGFTRDQAEWSLDQGASDVQTAVNVLCGPQAVAPGIKMNPGNLEGLRSLWVGNIQPEVTEKMLTTLFRRYGEIHSIRILHDRHCAFINYGNPLSPGKAMEALQGSELCGTAILIRFPDNNYLEKKDEPSKLVLKKSSLRASAEEERAKPPGATSVPRPRPSGTEQRANPVGAASAPRPKISGPVNGNECFFWRTTGCDFGEKCFYEHIPSHKGIDRRPPRLEKKFK